MYRCTKCGKLFRKHKNAVIHVINDHQESRLFAQFYVMSLPDILFSNEKPVDM